MKRIKLPARHERFCQEFIIDFNGARAARDSGFAKRSARVTASKLLTNPNIQKRIQQLMNDRSERTKITQDMVLRELAILAFSDFKNYGQIDNDGGLEFYPFKKIEEEKTRAIKSMKEVSGAQSHSMGLKLHDKVKPLELIGKHLSMFNEKLEFPKGIPLNVSAPELIKLVKKGLEKVRKKNES